MPYNGSARSEANLIKGVLPFLFIACSGAVLADTCLQSPDAFRSWVNKGEPYSFAVYDGSDPQKLFQEANAALLQATTNYRRDPNGAMKLDGLAKAAKAALEAREITPSLLHNTS
jgi:hypothetical protein